MVGMGSAGGYERRDCPGLVDTFFQELAVGGLFVDHGHFGIDWIVFLAVRVVDFVGGEERVHAEGTGFVRHDWDNVFTKGFVFEELAEHVDKDAGGAGGLFA